MARAPGGRIRPGGVIGGGIDWSGSPRERAMRRASLSPFLGTGMIGGAGRIGAIPRVPGDPYRSFDGSTDSIYTSGGAVGTPGTSAFTCLILVKPTSLFFGVPIALFDTVSALTLIQIAFTGPNNWRVEHGFGAIIPSTLPLTLGDWQLIGVSKAASGAGVVRYHRAVLGAAWEHADGDSTLGPSNVCNQVLFGRGAGGGGPFNPQGMGLSVAAIWNRGLSDAEINSITDATADMQALSGLVALWQFNQASVSTVSDLTGGGANQNAISGTSVVTDTPGWWTFAVGLAASASAAATASGLLSAPQPLTASASAVASESATLIVKPTIVANASSAVASTSAALSVASASVPLTGSASAVGSATGVVSAPQPLTGSASAAASV